MMRSSKWAGLLLMGVGAVAALGNVMEDYESFGEGFLGTTFSHAGVNYLEVNQVSGVFPSGDTFTPADLGDQFTIEDATLLYNDFPGYGSPVKSLTFGQAYVPGPNLTIGPIASAWMSLDELSNGAALDIAYYENGPWGGIVVHLDGLRNGNVVTSDSFTISDLGGRDNPNYTSLSIGGANFDGLHLYSTFGDQYSAPRGMIDNLTITSVPEPASLVLLVAAGALALRRRG